MLRQTIGAKQDTPRFRSQPYAKISCHVLMLRAGEGQETTLTIYLKSITLKPGVKFYDYRMPSAKVPDVASDGRKYPPLCNSFLSDRCAE